MIFTKANNVIVLDPRRKKNKNKIVCKFRTSRKRRDISGRILYTYDDFYGEFISDSFEKALSLKNRERINIKRAVVIIEGEKLPRIKVFDFEICKNQEQSPARETKYIEKVIRDDELRYV